MNSDLECEYINDMYDDDVSSNNAIGTHSVGFDI